MMLALVVFNLSIDPPDMLKNMDLDPELEEDLSINEIESFSELVMEQAFNFENAFPETDDPDSDNVVKKVEIFSPLEKGVSIALKFVLIEQHTSFFYEKQACLNIWPDILNPPPEV